MSDNEVVEVEATTVETDILPLGGAERWLAQKREEVDKAKEDFGIYPVTDDETYKQAKRDRAEANKFVKAINSERIEMVKGINEAVKGFKAAADEVALPISAVADGLGANIKAFEQTVIENRYAMLKEFYEDMAPQIALPLEGCTEPLVSFDRIVEKFGMGQFGAKTPGKNDGTKWLNFGTNDELARQQLEASIVTIRNAEETLAKTVKPEDLEYAKSVFFDTLDLLEAEEAVRRMHERQAQVAAMEQERAEWALDAPQNDSPAPNGDENQKPDNLPTLDASGTKNGSESLKAPSHFIYVYGDEYVLNDMYEFCRNHGIKLNYVVTEGRIVPVDPDTRQRKTVVPE